MFVEPSQAPVSKPAMKADPTAPARSAIRRQRTVRYIQNTRDHQSTISASNPRRNQGHARLLPDRRSLLEDIRSRETTSRPISEQPLPNDITDLDAVVGQTNSSTRREADIAHSAASQRSRLESGRALLRDALSYERPGQRMRVAHDTTVPEVPELRTSETRSPHPRYMPRPPYTSGDALDRLPTHETSTSLGSASLTPRFAPAHRPHPGVEDVRVAREQTLSLLAERLAAVRETEDGPPIAPITYEIYRLRNRSPAELCPEYLEAETDYLHAVSRRLDAISERNTARARARERELAELPPLRRTSHRTLRENSRPGRGQLHGNFDGLGDRQRSFSPDDDAWETLLTTIPDDDRVPSASSSFASTTASASASSRSFHSVTSHGTLTTAPFGSTESEACEVDLNDSDEALENEEDFVQADGAVPTQWVLPETQYHLDRIDALAARLREQQSRDEQMAAGQRRSREREAELRRLEADLQNLERQIRLERSSATGSYRDVARERAGLERL